MNGLIFAGAAAVLALELLELRIFSYAIDPQLVYSAISVALLGLGAGAMAVTRWPRLARFDAGDLGALGFGGFSLGVVLAHVVFARASVGIGFGQGFLVALPIFALFVVPYLCLGVMLAAATAREGIDLHRAYLANLAGSGAGSVLLYPLLRPAGAERLVALLALAGAALALALGWRSRWRWLGALALAASLPAMAWPERVFAFQPDPGDLYGVARAALQKMSPGRAPADYEPRLEFSRWDPVSRVEVYAFPGEFGLVNGKAPIKLFAQDGGAGSMLVATADHPDVARSLYEGTVYGGAYLLRPRPERALIVGLGGAPDVLAALHNGAQRVTGVEINASAIEAIGERYASFLGGPYQRPGVSILHLDGRAFFERNRDRFDVLQMTGADTYSAGSGGAFMFSENYLYTSEAFSRYLDALAPGGVLSIIRFGLEPVRVVSTAIKVLRARGVREPHRHLVVLAQGIWVNVIVSRDPLDEADGARVVQQVIERGSLERVRIPVYDALGFGLSAPLAVLYAPGFAPPNPYSGLISAAATGSERRALAAFPLDFSPISDDRPFFFQYLTPARLGALLHPGEHDYYVRGLRAHLLFLAGLAALGAVLTLGPLRGRRPPGALSYFGALGLAYLFVELSVLQKSALFLGHPTYSAAITLCALLLWSGLGAHLSGRLSWPPERTGRLAAAVLVPLLLIAQPALAALFRALLPLPFEARVVALALALGPLGLAMGVPFPAGLRALRPRGEQALAWAIGVNAFASVIASLLAVPVAMFSGFSAVGSLAAALYALAAFSAAKLVQG